jgi:two-component system, NarL family, response regulator NreC
MPQTTVLLVDDHLLVRQGCRRILEQRKDVTVVGEASSGEEGLKKIEELKPHVVFMDLNLPGIGGIDVTRRLKIERPMTKVIVLSVHTDEAYVYRALEAGAAAYIVKQGGAQELEDALNAVTSGHMYLSPLVSQSVVATYVKYGSRVAPSAEAPLTAKELEVTHLLTQGLSSKEIAQRLGSSPQTVDVHRKNIMKKLAIHSVPELVKWAIRNKLISVDE